MRKRKPYNTKASMTHLMPDWDFHCLYMDKLSNVSRNIYRILLTLEKKNNTSRKQAYIISTPLKPHFYVVQGYILFFLFLLKSIDCMYSLEPPRQGGSNEYPQSML